MILSIVIVVINLILIENCIVHLYADNKKIYKKFLIPMI